MTGLGLNAATPPKAGLGLDFRAGWLKHVGLAISGASGAAIVIGAYDVLRSQPDKAFALLQGWGPMFLIAIVALFIVARLFEGLNSTVRESFSTMAAGMHASAEASGRTSEALTRLADLGGEQARETHRLAMFAAQESQNVYERLDRQDEVLQEMHGNMQELMHGMKGVHSLLSKEKAALDRKEQDDGF